MATDRAATLAALRQHIAAVAPVRVHRQRLHTGLPELERHLGGWPRPGISALVGPPGVGRLQLVLPALARLTSAGHPVAVVDPVAWLYPPGLPGVDLAQLLLVRPGSGRAAWAAEQLAACGAFRMVLLLDPPRLGRGGRRLQRAAEEGEAALLVLGERADPALPADLRLRVCGPGRVVVEKGGRQPPGTEVHLRRRVGLPW